MKSLPTIDVPISTVELPSSGKKVRIRPFIVKEEKLLLMALETNNLKDIIDTTKQVISNCLIDGDINIDRLPFFDIDYLFIAMRAKSVGEKIQLRFICKNVVQGEEGPKECGTPMLVDVDISNIEVRNLNIPKEIEISPKIRVQMKYPSYAVMKNIYDSDRDIDKKIKYIIASIDKIWQGDEVFDVKDYKKEDLTAFLEGLTEEQFSKLEYFVDNYPEFSVILKKTCSKCGFNHVKRYSEFGDFFQ